MLLFSLSQYRVPFDTSRVPIAITQGYNGKYSHFKVSAVEDFSFSLDFGVALGTEVLAARSGLVKRLFGKQPRYYTGLDRTAAKDLIGNFVEIEHDDGTIGHYQHLDAASFLDNGLTRGARIAQGQPLARTGQSGWIGPQPHLHFMVYEAKDGIKTIPVFSEYGLRLLGAPSNG